MKPINVAKVLAGLLLVAGTVCRLGLEPAEVKHVILLEEPIYAADYRTSGRFALSLAALAEDSSVIPEPGIGQFSIIVDSVSPGIGELSIALRDIRYFKTCSLPNENPEAIPPLVSVGLLLDASGSMMTNDPERLRVDAAKGFVRLVADDTAANIIAVSEFSVAGVLDWWRLLCGYRPAGDSVPLLEALDKVGAAGATPMLTAMYHDLEYIGETVPKDSFDRKLVTLTDGQYNVEDPVYGRPDVVVASALARRVRLYFVGLGDSVIEGELRWMARRTGGSYVHAFSVDQLKEAFERVFWYAFNPIYVDNRVELACQVYPWPLQPGAAWLRVTVSTPNSRASTRVKLWLR